MGCRASIFTYHPRLFCFYFYSLEMDYYMDAAWVDMVRRSLALLVNLVDRRELTLVENPQDAVMILVDRMYGSSTRDLQEENVAIDQQQALVNLLAAGQESVVQNRPDVRVNQLERMDANVVRDPQDVLFRPWESITRDPRHAVLQQFERRDENAPPGEASIMRLAEHAARDLPERGEGSSVEVPQEAAVFLRERREDGGEDVRMVLDPAVTDDDSGNGSLQIDEDADQNYPAFISFSPNYYAERDGDADRQPYIPSVDDSTLHADQVEGIGVTPTEIERYLGVTVEEFLSIELLDLQHLFLSHLRESIRNEQSNARVEVDCRRCRRHHQRHHIDRIRRNHQCNRCERRRNRRLQLRHRQHQDG